MWIIREILTLIFVAAALIIDLPLHLITWVIEQFKPGACSGFRHAYVHYALKCVWFLAGGKTTTIGLEKLPTDRPFLIVANHRSIFDIILIGSQVSYPIGFVAKKELQKTPIGLIMTEIHCLFLDREDPRQGLKTILTAIDYVKGGIAMCIFPEGTRSKVEGELLPFHAGSFKIATKAKCPVVPVTITGTGDMFEGHLPWLKCCPVVIEYGDPIETADMDRNMQKALPDQMYSLIGSTYAKNSAMLTASGGNG